MAICGRQKNGPQRCPQPNPQNLWLYEDCGKGGIKIQGEIQVTNQLPLK